MSSRVENQGSGTPIVAPTSSDEVSAFNRWLKELEAGYRAAATEQLNFAADVRHMEQRMDARLDSRLDQFQARMESNMERLFQSLPRLESRLINLMDLHWFINKMRYDLWNLGIVWLRK